MQRGCSRPRTGTSTTRRCGPRLGHPCVPFPWCLPVATNLGRPCNGGDPDRRPNPAQHYGAGSPLRLFLKVSRPTPHACHASTHSGFHPSLREGGEAGQLAPLPVRPPPPLPLGAGAQSHGCGPLADQVLPKGGIWSASQWGLVRSLILHPDVQLSSSLPCVCVCVWVCVCAGVCAHPHLISMLYASSSLAL